MPECLMAHIRQCKCKDPERRQRESIVDRGRLHKSRMTFLTARSPRTCRACGPTHVSCERADVLQNLLSLLLDEIAFSIFLWRMGGEPGFLIFDEVFGIFAQVAQRFERELARDVVRFVVGR